MCGKVVGPEWCGKGRVYDGDGLNWCGRQEECGCGGRVGGEMTEAERSEAKKRLV